MTTRITPVRRGRTPAFSGGLLAALLAGGALAAPEPPIPPEPAAGAQPYVQHISVATPGLPVGIGNVTTSSAEFLAAPLNVMGRLFPPSLIMRQQQELGLSSSQAEAIKAEMRNFQGKVVDIQWDLNDRQARLDALLEAEQIDAAAAESAIDAVLQSENALKKAHLVMLIAIRNALEPAQVAQLEKAQHGRFFVHPLDAPPAINYEFRSEE